jgi:coproporphyrinogen III oxidase-like Fe-S oxidoreductase
MSVENFVGYISRGMANRYVQFDENTSGNPPQPKDAQAPLMLYMHIPFCEELCTYCSFHRVKFQEELARDYFVALRKEILMYHQRGGYNFKSLYIGGGTPTVLMDELTATIEWIKKYFDIEEISVETNPNHLDKDKMMALKAVGVGRLSVGIQSFDDDILRATDRFHKYGSGEEIAQRLQETQGIFKTLNADMIYNFPGQTEEILQRDLDTLLKLKVDQVTFYPLMMASTTRNKIEKTMGVVCDARGQALYEMIMTTLKKEYKLSTAWCFSRDASLIDEYVVNYEEYAGIGSGAFGYLNGCVYANSFNIPEYIQRVEEGKSPIAARRNFSRLSMMMYDFMMQFFGLKVDTNHLRQKYGFCGAVFLWPVMLFFRLTGGVGKGDREGVFTTTKPYFGVIMMREFFTAVNNFRDYCRSRA